MVSDVFTWAGRITVGAAPALGAIRLIRGLEAGAINDVVWVCGPRLKPVDEEAVRRVPWEERYEVREGNQLRRTGRILSEGTLPICTWRPLTSFLCGRLPVFSGSGSLPTGNAIELRAAMVVDEPNLLEAAAEDWLAYVETAPEVRLQWLAFALNHGDAKHVLIRGLPLPPLPGIRFVETDHIATPAGSHWHPPVAAECVRTALGVPDAELVILRTDGSWSRIPRFAWIAATRSTVRLMLAPERYA